MSQEPNTQLNKAEELLPQIAEAYETSLTSQSISEELTLNIKAYLELLSSALNSCAALAFQACCLKLEETETSVPNDRFKYPIFDDAAKFLVHIKSNYPGLIQNYPPVFRLFMTDQPFVVRSSWLRGLRLLSENERYANLSIHNGQESRSISLTTFHGEEMELGEVNQHKPSTIGRRSEPEWTGLSFEQTEKEILLNLSEMNEGVRNLVHSFLNVFGTLNS